MPKKSYLAEDTDFRDRMSSRSTKIRKEGNKYFANFTNSLHVNTKREFLEKAIGKYDSALEEASNPKDKSSACKNLAVSYGHLFEIEDRKASVKSTQWKMSMENFILAIQYGLESGGQLNPWLKDVFESMKKYAEVYQVKTNFNMVADVFYSAALIKYK